MVVFATSVFLLLAFIYWRTAGFMTAQTDETIEAEIAGLAEQYRGSGVNGLINIIRERVARDPNAKSIYLLTTDDFLKLAGNIDQWPQGSPSEAGWINFTLNQNIGWKGPERRARARIFEVQGGLHLLVGRDVDEHVEAVELPAHHLQEEARSPGIAHMCSSASPGLSLVWA